MVLIRSPPDASSSNPNAEAFINDGTDPAGFNNEKVDLPELAVVDKNMFSGKILSTPARLSDVDKLHSDLIRTEDGVNRLARHLNRKVNQASRELTELKDSTQVLTTRVNTLANGYGATQITERLNTTPNNPLNPILNWATPSPLKNLDQSTNHDNDDIDAIVEATPQHQNREEPQENQDFELNPEGFHYVNMLFTESAPTFSTFSGNSALEFDRWARKFSDLLECNGSKWNEAEKLARLKACLDGEPRRIFDELDPNHKSTPEAAIRKLRESLDTPQNQELTYQALSLCKQREGESVDEFSARLIPLVEATTTDLAPGASEEVLCRAFLEKLSPNLKFLTRTLSGPVRRDFKAMRMNAREAEMMYKEVPKSTPFPLCPITGQNNRRVDNNDPPNHPRGNFRTWAPTNSNREPLGPQQRNQNNWPTNSNTPRGSNNFNGNLRVLKTTEDGMTERLRTTQDGTTGRLKMTDAGTTIVRSATTATRIAPCEDHQRILVQVADRTFEVDQVDGKISSVHVHKINEAELDMGKPARIPKLTPHAFHHLVLLNLTDLATHAFATNLAQGLFGDDDFRICGVHVWISRVHREMKDFKTAKEHFEESVKLYKTNSEAIHMELKEEASKFFGDFSPQSFLPHFNYGKALIRDLVSTRDILDADNDINQIAWENLEVARKICENQMRGDQMKLWMERKADVLLALGQTMTVSENFPCALEHFAKALDIRKGLFGDDDFHICGVHVWIGRVHLKMKDFKTANEHFEESVKLYKTSSEAIHMKLKEEAYEIIGL